MILDALELILGFLGIGGNIAEKISERGVAEENNAKRYSNDAVLNFLINLAYADKEIKPEEKKCLEELVKQGGFNVYAVKTVDECIEHALKNKMSIDELLKATVNKVNTRKVQLDFYKMAVLMAAQDNEIAPAEIQMINELEMALKITQAEKQEIFKRFEKKPSAG